MRRQLPLVLILAACASQAQDSQDVSRALEQENGGFDTVDEAPQFAEESAFTDASIEAATDAADTLANDPQIQLMDRATTTAGHKVLIVWGKIPADRDAQTPRDWSGSFTLSRGGLVVRHTIAFEDATDRLLPRTSINTVAFNSVTRPFVDGLALTVLDPNPSTTDALTLTYTADTGGATYALDLAQLENGPIVIDAGDGFKLVAIAQHRADGCDGGFMRGRWHALLPHVGVYLGVVTDRDGTPVGHVRGIYGQRRNGDAVMFGKFIDREGHFKGMLKGTYGNGEFKARWLDRQGDHGAIHGLYFEGATARAGHFVARWAETSCAQDQ